MTAGGFGQDYADVDVPPPWNEEDRDGRDLSGLPERDTRTGSPLTGDQLDRAQLLDDIEAFLARFVVYPTESARVAHVLWIAHCWFMDRWESTPRIAFLSPEPGSGKSRALEVTEPLVPRPVHAINVTPSYLFRKVSDEDGAPTILYDEIDTVFGPRAKDNEDIRGMLNAGHRRGATAGRCVIRGKRVDTEELPAYCAVALAGLDDLPDTIMTRSVVVRMRKRAPGEKVEPWRLRINGPQTADLVERLTEWASLDAPLEMDWPDMPDGVEDRAADVWEALLAVADMAGRHWPDRARVTAVTAVTDAAAHGHLSLGVTLLRDIRSVFDESGVDRLSTTELIESLIQMDESPWADLRGKPLDARGLARRLAKYDVSPRPLRLDQEVFKGYEKQGLQDVWSRYLPAVAVTSVTSVTQPTLTPDKPDCPGCDGQLTESPPAHCACPDVHTQGVLT